MQADGTPRPLVTSLISKPLALKATFEMHGRQDSCLHGGDTAARTRLVTYFNVKKRTLNRISRLGLRLKCLCMHNGMHSGMQHGSKGSSLYALAVHWRRDPLLYKGGVTARAKGIAR